MDLSPSKVPGLGLSCTFLFVGSGSSVQVWDMEFEKLGSKFRFGFRGVALVSRIDRFGVRV